MGQSDILDFLDRTPKRDFFSVSDMTRTLNLPRSCVARNVKSLYKYRSCFDLEFRIGAKNMFFFRKKR